MEAKTINTVKDLYEEFIRDIYNAEILLVPELQFFAEKVVTKELKRALTQHVEKTNAHITRLEEIQEDLQSDMLQEHCRTMKEMIKEIKGLVDRCSGEKLTERAVVGSLHRLTHCMITVYQMLVSMADELDLEQQKHFLQQNLDDEIQFDKAINAYGFTILLQEFTPKKRLS